MKYLVRESFKVKTSQGEKTIENGQVVSLPEDKAAPLIEAGKIEPLRVTFERSFHKHMEKMKTHHLTAYEIKRRDPNTYKVIQSAAKEMDAAWYREDLKAFKDALERVEGLYMEAVAKL